MILSARHIKIAAMTVVTFLATTIVVYAQKVATPLGKDVPTAEALVAMMPHDIEPVEAPFAMPKMQRPTFPQREINITKAGAKQKKLSTKAIQKAIDNIAKKGGGTVIIPKGQWLTGRIELKSNVCLDIEEGAELHFSGDIKDYLPAVAGRNEGVDIYGPGAMIYADGQENIAVIGKGKIIAPSRDCELLEYCMAGIPESVQQMPLQKRIFDGIHENPVPCSKTDHSEYLSKHTPLHFSRLQKPTLHTPHYSLCLPVFFGPMNCRGVFLEGVTFEGSVFWNIVPVYCDGVIIRGVRVESAGIARTDGIDIDSSVNALIEYTSLDCGDDCFTLKAGRGLDGLTKNRPTENVVIRHCLALHGAGGLTVGSETAAGIRNVYMKDVVIDAPKYGIYFKTRRPRGGGGENIWFENVRLLKPKTRAIYWDMLGSATYVGKLAERAPLNLPQGEKQLYANANIKSPWDKLGGVLTPYFRNIHFKNITVDSCTDFIKAIGLPESPVDNVTFENIVSPSCQKVTLQDVGIFSIN